MSDKDKPKPGKDVQPDSQRAPQSTPEGRVQAKVDKDVEKGLRGVEVDLTPNENYTVAGVTAGLPTPEASENPPAARVAASNPDAVQ